MEIYNKSDIEYQYTSYELIDGELLFYEISVDDNGNETKNIITDKEYIKILSSSLNDIDDMVLRKIKINKLRNGIK